jgi:hypothetical protein
MYLFIYAARNVCGLVGRGGWTTWSTRGVCIAIITQPLHQQQAQQFRRDRGKVQNHKNGKEFVQSLVKTLVDCYFVHFKYLECWCIGTVCEENDTEK